MFDAGGMISTSVDEHVLKPWRTDWDLQTAQQNGGSHFGSVGGATPGWFRMALGESAMLLLFENRHAQSLTLRITGRLGGKGVLRTYSWCSGTSVNVYVKQVCSDQRPVVTHMFILHRNSKVKDAAVPVHTPSGSIGSEVDDDGDTLLVPPQAMVLYAMIASQAGSCSGNMSAAPATLLEVASHLQAALENYTNSTNPGGDDDGCRACDVSRKCGGAPPDWRQCCHCQKQVAQGATCATNALETCSTHSDCGGPSSRLQQPPRSVLGLARTPLQQPPRSVLGLAALHS